MDPFSPYPHIVKSKFVTVVEGDQRAPFSIAKERRGRYSFPWIAPLYPSYVLLFCWVLSKAVSSTIFKVFGMTRPGIEPRSSRPLANTLPTRPMIRCCVLSILALTWLVLMVLFSAANRRDSVSFSKSYQSFLAKDFAFFFFFFLFTH